MQCHFDESLNDMTQCCEMNLLVRNFDETARLKLDFMMRDFLVMELSEIFKSSSMMQ